MNKLVKGGFYMSKINENIEDFTKQILLDNDMLYKVPVDVVKIAKAYGINVYVAELSNEISGAIRHNSETDNFEILVNKNNVEARQRFTIAHELGHYFLHRDMLKDSDVHIDTLYRATTQTNVNTKEQEREVDYFAGALLMNRIAIEKLIDNYTVADLAELFKVSSSAMAVRLDILGLL